MGNESVAKKLMPLIGICDDEKKIRELLAEKVRDCCPEAELCFYGDGAAVLAAREKPDILFLDIQMPGVDGMAAARELRKQKKAIILIFITAIEERVFDAFDVGAFHYLVKPFSQEKFSSVLKAALCQVQEKQEEGEKGEALAKSPSEWEPSILVKTKGECIRVPLEKLLYAEVYNRKVILHKADGVLEYYGRISDLEAQVGSGFVRTHRSYLVHLKYVERYNAQTVCLEDGSLVPMAKKKYPEFVRAYLRYMKGETSVPR